MTRAPLHCLGRWTLVLFAFALGNEPNPASASDHLDKISAGCTPLNLGAGILETPKMPETSYADGTHAVVVVCADEFDPFSREEVQLHYYDASGQVVRTEVLWYSAEPADPPDLDKVTIAPDGSGIFELYRPPSGAIRYRPLGPSGAVGLRRNVTLFPGQCGGVTWTGIRSGRAWAGEVFTGVLTNSSMDGAARFEPDGMGGWTCSITITTPTTLPGGLPAEFVDRTGRVAERTYVTLSDFLTSADQGVWNATALPPTQVVANGFPLLRGGSVANFDGERVDFNIDEVWFPQGASSPPETLARTNYASGDTEVVGDFAAPITGLDVTEAEDGTVATQGKVFRIAVVDGEAVLDIEELLASGDMLDGRTVANIRVDLEATAAPFSVFTVSFFDFSSDYFIAIIAEPDKVPSLSRGPLAALAVALAVLGLWALARSRRQRAS